MLIDKFTLVDRQVRLWETRKASAAEFRGEMKLSVVCGQTILGENAECGWAYFRKAASCPQR